MDRHDDDHNETLAQFVLHLLDPHEREEVEEHVKKCMICTLKVRALSSFDPMPPSLPPPLLDRFLGILLLRKHPRIRLVLFILCLVFGTVASYCISANVSPVALIQRMMASPPKSNSN